MKVAPLPAASWEGFACSVRGASHVRRGAPNQDAGGTRPVPGGAGVVLAVADGHGDPIHARSDRGSRFAVNIALELLEKWVGANRNPPRHLEQEAVELRGRFLSRWREEVDADLAADPPESVEVRARPSDHG